MRAARCDLDDLGNERQMAERGYFVQRGAIPPQELERMAAFVEAVPLPTKLLCGASDVQPQECMLRSEEIRKHFPLLSKVVNETLTRWRESGFGQEAAMGWPLTVEGGEFISINKWPFVHNASCVLAEVFDAAEPHVDRSCLDSCPPHERSRPDDSTTPCWSGCRFEAIVERTDAATVRAALANASKPAAACAAPRPLILDGPLEYVMGGSGFYDFGQWGQMRLLSNLKAWLTTVSNRSIYQGWHDWHADGPSNYGRYHKAFALVSKSNAYGEEAGAALRTHTNVRLAPADTLFAHADCFDALAESAADDHTGANAPAADADANRRADADTDADADADASVAASSRLRVDPARLRAWGFNHHWHGFEKLGCDIPLEPGDVLYFREDVWHRTQDMAHDRLAFIMDILRWPLPRHPAARTTQAPVRRVPQPKMISLILRLPPPIISAAIAELDAASGCSPAEVADAAALRVRGFAIARQAVDATAIAAALSGLDDRPVFKVEAGGRVYTDFLGARELRQLSPQLVESLQALLDMWHANRRLPRTWRLHEETAGGVPYTPRVGGGQFVMSDPERARRAGAADVSTTLFDWHVDGDGHRHARLHKLWVLLRKRPAEARDHSNLVLTSSVKLELVAQRALDVLRRTNAPLELLPPAAAETRIALARRDALLEKVGCAPDLEVGDVVFFAEDVLHRTQDLSAERVALLINVE